MGKPEVSSPTDENRPQHSFSAVTLAANWQVSRKACDCHPQRQAHRKPSEYDHEKDRRLRLRGLGQYDGSHNRREHNSQNARSHSRRLQINLHGQIIADKNRPFHSLRGSVSPYNGLAILSPDAMLRESQPLTLALDDARSRNVISFGSFRTPFGTPDQLTGSPADAMTPAPARCAEAARMVSALATARDPVAGHIVAMSGDVPRLASFR
jgi:hypothetical protein